jgi:hypothetical protein
VLCRPVQLPPCCVRCSPLLSCGSTTHRLPARVSSNRRLGVRRFVYSGVPGFIRSQFPRGIPRRLAVLPRFSFLFGLLQGLTSAGLVSHTPINRLRLPFFGCVAVHLLSFSLPLRSASRVSFLLLPCATFSSVGEISLSANSSTAST